jgi:hypothetical protein
VRRARLVLALLLLAGGLVSCQERVPVVVPLVTVQWDPPVDAAPDLRYEVVVSPWPTGPVTLIGTVSTTECTYTLPAEGKYRFGVRGARTVDGVEYFSAYCWSDAEGDPSPWYVSYVKALGKPQRVRLK